MSSEKLLDERHRLLQIREHLGVRSRPDDKSFESEVVAACAKKIQPIVNAHSSCPGEEIIGAIAKEFGVHFEEVHSREDIESLQRKYLVEQRELGFGMLEAELSDPTVDALMFQRMWAIGEARDRWIAVINSQVSRSRGYWSRAHELIHRVAEPPQQRLPFYRHREDHANRVERIVDLGAAEIAFPRSVFAKHVLSVTGRELTWDLVQAIRKRFAPTASLQASAKALLRYWPQPAFLLVASLRGRLGRPTQDVALRLDVDGFNDGAALSKVLFFTNMRVPTTSPVWGAFDSGQTVSDFENLSTWVTSDGDGLPNRRAFTSGLRLNSVVYGLISLV